MTIMFKCLPPESKCKMENVIFSVVHGDIQMVARLPSVWAIAVE